MHGIEPGEQQGWLRSVLELLPLPTQLIEPVTGHVLFANGAARLLPAPLATEGGDRDATEMTDEVGALIPPEHWPRPRAARGESLDGVRVTCLSQGRQASYVVSSGVVPGVAGDASQVLLTYLDVTRLVATEAKLREVIRVRDDFFSFATHELKDPLSSLLLSVEVLSRIAAKQGSVPADILRERLDVSKRQGKRLAQMIDNFLDVSRINNGRLQLQVEALDLRDLVLEVVGRFRELARELGVPLDVEPSGPIIGYFDRVQLEHVIGNLLSNALKYGGGRPVVARLRGDDATATLEVEDEGDGISEADRARIFERFERASDSNREKSLGLGLYIVRSIVEAHGGSIDLRSEPGRGTTFVVMLPRKRMPCGDATTPEDVS